LLYQEKASGFLQKPKERLILEGYGSLDRYYTVLPITSPMTAPSVLLPVTEHRTTDRSRLTAAHDQTLAAILTPILLVWLVTV